MRNVRGKKQLSEKSAARLQNILSKRFGRILSASELQEAYNSLMEFAYALVDLIPENESAEEKKSLAGKQQNNV